MTKYTWRGSPDSYIIMQGKKKITPTNVVRSLNMKWGRYIKQINPHKESIILVKKPKDQSEGEFGEALQGLADEILARIGRTTLLVGVAELSDWQQVDEVLMEKYGWVRSDRVLAYIEDAFSDLAGDEEE